MFFNPRAYKHQFYDGTYLRQQGDHIDCVAMVPAYQSSAHQPPFFSPAFRTALSPCALIAVFGTPGQGVRAWLEAGRYSMAQTYGWFAAEKRPWRGGPWAEWSNTTSGADWPSGIYDWMQYTGLLDIALTMRPPYQYGAAGMRCINGEEASCRTAFLHPGYAIPDGNRMPADLTLDDDVMQPSPTIVTTVRPPVPSLVATLIKEFGRDRFPEVLEFGPASSNRRSGRVRRIARRVDRAMGKPAAGSEHSYEAKHVNADILLGVTLKRVVAATHDRLVGARPGNRRRGRKAKDGVTLGARYGRRAAPRPCSLAGSTGLTQWSSNPAAMVRAPSVWAPHPVTAISRTAASRASARIRRATS